MYTQLKRSVKAADSRNWYFSVDKEDLGGNVEYRRLNELPDKKEYPAIHYLSFVLHPRNKTQAKFLPGFIKDLPDLRSLTIPIDWVNKIELPAGISVLNLTAPVLNYDDQQEFPASLTLDRLKYLAVPELVKPYKIDIKKFGSLEWIEYDLDAEKTERILVDLADLKGLQHLVFAHAKNFDVFTPFRDHPIETLELFACTGRKFPIENIVQLKGLKSIYINNLAVPFDCSLLLELPGLQEVSFLNMKSITNVERILEHKAIDSLSIKFCNNPFKGSGKDRFFGKGFKALSIDYA